MFEVAYETTFCATHVLTDGGRPIEPVHGHDWRVEVVAAGETLDRIGVVVDFEHLKAAVGEVCRRAARSAICWRATGSRGAADQVPSALVRASAICRSPR